MKNKTTRVERSFLLNKEIEGKKNSNSKHATQPASWPVQRNVKTFNMPNVRYV